MIKIIRLVTGDDVISEVEKKGDTFTLKKPHRLLFSKDGLASMPLCPFSKDKDYEISSSNVLFECDPDDEIRNSYAQQVGAVLVASSSLITE